MQPLPFPLKAVSCDPLLEQLVPVYSYVHRAKRIEKPVKFHGIFSFFIVSADYSSYFSLSTSTKDTVAGVDFYEVNLIQQQAIDRAITKDFFLIIRVSFYPEEHHLIMEPSI